MIERCALENSTIKGELIGSINNSVYKKPKADYYIIEFHITDTSTNKKKTIMQKVIKMSVHIFFILFLI